MVKFSNTNTGKNTDLTPKQIAYKVKALGKEINSAHAKAEAARQRAIRSQDDDEAKVFANACSAFWRKRRARLREEKDDYQYLGDIISSR